MIGPEPAVPPVTLTVRRPLCNINFLAALEVNEQNFLKGILPQFHLFFLSIATFDLLKEDI